MTWMEFFGSFLAGAITGAAGSYLGNRFTDQRRRRESASATQRQFHLACESMSDLIAALKAEATRPGWEMVREIFALPTKGVLAGTSQRRFMLYEDEIADLLTKLRTLESYGFVTEVTTKSVPIFRMTEAFVAMLRENGE